MPNNQQYEHKPKKLERVQDSIELKRESKYPPNVSQAPTQSNIINCEAPEWTVSVDDKNSSVAADRGDSNVMTLPPGAYYGKI